MRSFWNNIMMVYQPTAGEHETFMERTEFNGLKKVYDRIMENLNGSPLDKNQWMKKVLPSISSLPMESQIILLNLFQYSKNSIPPP
jgi:hypothetical protein